MLAHAFKFVGLSQTADATLKSLDFFLAGVPDDGPDKTNRCMDEKNAEEVGDFFLPLDREIWKLDDDGRLDRVLAECSRTRASLSKVTPMLDHALEPTAASGGSPAGGALVAARLGGSSARALGH